MKLIPILRMTSLVYLICAFVAMSPNPASWTSGVRSGAVIAWILLYLLAAFSTKLEEDKAAKAKERENDSLECMRRRPYSND